VGYAAFSFSLPIALGIIALIWILVISYRQVIQTYSQGGGAYMVAKENIGAGWGRLAGASLLIDYMLTVAVSISAGVMAITSAFPKTIEFKLEICLALLLIMVWLNLRGVSESGTIFSIPTYLFIVVILVLVAKGYIDFFTGRSVVPVDEIIPTSMPQGLTWFLILKAFSSGCSAVTGLEAISDAVPHFKKPSQRNAILTQMILGALLAVIFSGITFAAVIYHIHPDTAGHTSVLSMITEHAFGRGTFYYVVQASTMLILVLAANTAFNGFPIMSSIMAQDKNFPRIFAQRGSRLAYNVGILALGILAAILLVVFDGDTDSLIPLYAIGVFSSFTLAQGGLVLKWVREKQPGWQGKFIVNGLGALISFIVLLIFIWTKFMNGAWIVIAIIPPLVYALKKIHDHYEDVADDLRLDMTVPMTTKESVIIVPVAGIHKVVAASIGFAKTLSPNVIAFYVATSEEEEAKMKERWKQWNPGVRLVTHYSTYRTVLNPLIEFIERVDNGIHERSTIMVLLPKFITLKWWHRLLHNQTANKIQNSLQSRRDIVVAIMPYHLHE
jgi:amino acid transporter